MEGLDRIIFDPTNCDFRDSYWGDTRENIFMSERMDYYANEPHVVAYKKLIEGLYYISCTHSMIMG